MFEICFHRLSCVPFKARIYHNFQSAAPSLFPISAPPHRLFFILTTHADRHTDITVNGQVQDCWEYRNNRPATNAITNSPNSSLGCRGVVFGAEPMVQNGRDWCGIWPPRRDTGRIKDTDCGVNAPTGSMPGDCFRKQHADQRDIITQGHGTRGRNGDSLKLSF